MYFYEEQKVFSTFFHLSISLFLLFYYYSNRRLELLEDILCEEFVIILQNTTLQSALIIAEKLRKIMENTIIAPVGSRSKDDYRPF